MLLLPLAALFVAILFIQPLLAYVLDTKRLRKFPSPPTAGISSIWRIMQNLKYRHFAAVDAAHQKLDTHVRIAPNNISICDPLAVQEIYGHGAKFLKDAWYDGGAGEFRHMADTGDKAEHQAKRKALAHVFAQKTITNLEPVIADTISTLLAQLDTFATSGKTVNMRRYLNYFTIDVFSRLLTGQSLHCLERGNDMVAASTERGRTYQAPFIKSLHDATHINTILGFEAPLLGITKKLFSRHPYKKAGADYDNIIFHLVNKRLAAEDNEQDNIVSKLLVNNKGEGIGLPLGVLLAESSVMMNAGTDTTTAALTNTVYLLHKHPRKLERLRQEVDEAYSIIDGTLPYPVLAKMPYLRARIEESLRLRPASSMGLPRVVPEGGRTIAGKFISEGVTVSVPTFSLLRHEEAFGPDAAEFRPERWLTTDEAEKDRMAKAHFPFSTGPRACIGRNISYFEQVLVVVALVRNYEFGFVEGEDFVLRTIERFNSNPDEMEMWVKRRSLT